MTYTAYQDFIETILNSQNPPSPYNEELYFSFTEMNYQRSKRWMKTGILTDEIKEKIKSITTPQTWIIITEPWCGDAAHSVPFINKIAELNPLIKVEIQLRDTDSEIDNYLTNGGKAIPVVILRDENNQDMNVWGPRPKELQDLYLKMKEENLEFDDIKLELQKWYNQDKGQTIQSEFINFL